MAKPTKLDAAMVRRATRGLIEEQLILHPEALALRLEIDWGPYGVIKSRTTPLEEGETPTEAPTYQSTRYEAWGKYTVAEDRSYYLVKRLSS
ncbi:MAG TPA: hypothetical protein VH183_10525 [Burkholderiaceae bacterium]|jgi:hypothetical protein|nr:hypothetical protein [Burkholderiaceae bacterium]